MKREKAIKVQAWMDGELTGADLRDMEAWVAEDVEARRLAEDLRKCRSWLEAGDVIRPVPESREFYWSKIAREIDRLGCAADPATLAVQPWWRMWFAPAGALAALSVVALGWMWYSGFGSRSAHLAIGHEIETPIAEMSSFTFRSESERMTVVWVNWERK